MNARLHLKDHRGNHRILDGFFDDLIGMMAPDWKTRTTARSCQRYAAQTIVNETGIVPMGPMLICINGGRK